jgi:hypothetical protein
MLHVLVDCGSTCGPTNFLSKFHSAGAWSIFELSVSLLLSESRMASKFHHCHLKYI